MVHQSGDGRKQRCSCCRHQKAQLLNLQVLSINPDPYSKPMLPCKMPALLTVCTVWYFSAGVASMAYVQKKSTGLAEATPRESRHEKRRRKKEAKVNPRLHSGRASFVIIIKMYYQVINVCLCDLLTLYNDVDFGKL